METQNHPHSRGWFTSKLVFGLILIALGVAFALHNLGLLSADLTMRYWPMALVLLALERFWNRGPLAGSGHTLIMAAAFFQLMALERFDLIERWWPVVIVYWGILIVLRSVFKARRSRVCSPCCQDTNERLS